jgi:hypothetical protein
MTERKVRFTEKFSPIKASDLATILSHAAIESQKFQRISVEAARHTAGMIDAQYEWDTDSEQYLFNVLRAIISGSIKIVNGK